MKCSETSEPAAMMFPAKPQHLAEVRRWVEQLAAQLSLDHDKTIDFLTAVDEAVANAIRHGSPRGEQSLVHVTCRCTPAKLTVQVQDEGKGFSASTTASEHAPVVAWTMPGPEATGGRGLPLMCALSDKIQVESTPRGTRITLEKLVR